MKDNFFNYLGAENSLYGYQKSYKLVLLKCVIMSMSADGQAEKNAVVSAFSDFYLQRRRMGLESEFGADRRISDIESSSQRDIFAVIKSNPYNAIHTKGFLNLIVDTDGNWYFAFPPQLTEELTQKDYSRINQIIDAKLNLYFAQTVSTKCDDKVNKTNIQKNKMVINPFEKLRRRIIRAFPKKKFVGDIAVNDEEFEILCEYLKNEYLTMVTSGKHIVCDPILCTAMVQVGIRFYDGNYWSHIRQIIGSSRFNTNHQQWLGESAIQTLKRNGKYIISAGDRVNTILMHGFVSDHYANALFKFLFAFYRIDLERDINRNNKVAMDALVEVMRRNNNTGRTYFLVEQTADAVRFNARSCRMRIRRLLSLIDAAFWGEALPKNSSNRLTLRLCEWVDHSNDFFEEYARYNCGGSKSGKRSFSSPYYKCDFKHKTFEIVFPPQIIKSDDSNDIWWNIRLNGRNERCDCEIREAVTGQITENTSVKLNIADLFCDAHFDLMNGDVRERSFRSNTETIRFFDKNGDYIRNDLVPKGECFSFSREDFIPISEALIESESYQNLVFSYFDFQLGDIIRLPDGKPIIIGKKLEEGLSLRGRLKGACVASEEESLPLYSSVPSILVKALPNRVAGTAVRVNGQIFRMFDDTTLADLDLGDRSGESGYFFSLKNFGCTNDGIYEVKVDVPNDNKSRHWKFALLNDLCFEFEDAPYVFKPRGTISFKSGPRIANWDAGAKKDPSENAYGFEINAEKDTLNFDFCCNQDIIRATFNVPAFRYELGDGVWKADLPAEIWHKDFPTKITADFPSDRISFTIDEDPSISEIPLTTVFERSKSTGLFNCDMTKFKSWFGRDKAKRNIDLIYNSNPAPFLTVITRSFVTSCVISGDFENNILMGTFGFIGNSHYCADVKFNEKILAEKEPILNDRLEFAAELKSGMYTVSIFEDDDDGSGFGEPCYYHLHTYQCELINPLDLNGKSMRIVNLKRNNNIGFNILQLNTKYIINGLKQTSPEDKLNYRGTMRAENRYIDAIPVNVRVHSLKDLRFASITFIEDDEFYDLLYDHYAACLVTDEDKRMHGAEKYRRYEEIYADEFTFEFSFANNTRPVTSPSTNPPAQSWLSSGYNVFGEKHSPLPTKSGFRPTMPQQNAEVRIEDMHFSVRAYNCLSRSGIRTASDIVASVNSGKLIQVRNLGRKSAQEVVHKVESLGFAIDSTALKSMNLFD